MTCSFSAPCYIELHWRQVGSYVRHDPFINETWLIHMWNTTHSYLRHDSSICETWLIPMWHLTDSNARHDSFICETRLIHMRDMTHSYVRHVINETCLTYEWVMSRIWTRLPWAINMSGSHAHMTRHIMRHICDTLHIWYVIYVYVICHICLCDMSYMPVWYVCRFTRMTY